MALLKHVTHAVAVAGVHTLTLDDVTGLVVGYDLRVTGVLAAGTYNGTHPITAIDVDDRTVSYVTGNHTHAAEDTIGQADVPVTWADTNDVELFIGAASEADWLDLCTIAANEWCYDRRKAASYNDYPHVSPSPRATEAVCLYAGALYRERQSVDSFASFMENPITPPVGTLGRVKQLLGIERPAVA
jgi:hypothetical protein